MSSSNFTSRLLNSSFAASRESTRNATCRQPASLLLPRSANARLRGVNFQPGPGQRNQADRRILAVVPDRPRAQHAHIPVFQGGGIGGGNGDVFNGKVHGFACQLTRMAPIFQKRKSSSSSFSSYSSSSCHLRTKVHGEIRLAFPCSCEASGDWRGPGRFAYFRNHRAARSVLECPPSAVLLRRDGQAALPPLFPEAYQPVPVLIGTAYLYLLITRRRTIQSHWPLFNFEFTHRHNRLSSKYNFYEYRSHPQTTADLRGGD